jgi:hypothetical protein
MVDKSNNFVASDISIKKWTQEFYIYRVSIVTFLYHSDYPQDNYNYDKKLYWFIVELIY